MDIGWPEILIIAAVILVLFGSKKLPDAARAVGRSMRILKTEVKGLHDDDEPAPHQAQPPAQLPAGTVQAPAGAAPVTPAPAQPAPTVGDRSDTA